MVERQRVEAEVERRMGGAEVMGGRGKVVGGPEQEMERGGKEMGGGRRMSCEFRAALWWMSGRLQRRCGHSRCSAGPALPPPQLTRGAPPEGPRRRQARRRDGCHRRHGGRRAVTDGRSLSTRASQEGRVTPGYDAHPLSAKGGQGAAIAGARTHAVGLSSVTAVVREKEAAISGFAELRGDRETSQLVGRTPLTPDGASWASSVALSTRPIVCCQRRCRGRLRLLDR